jgi:hypothetical protein
VTELEDVPDSKSGVLERACGFDPHRGYKSRGAVRPALDGGSPSPVLDRKVPGPDPLTGAGPCAIMGNMAKQTYTTETLSASFALPKALKVNLPWVARTEELFILGPGHDGTYAYGINLAAFGSDEDFVASTDDVWGVDSFVNPDESPSFNAALLAVGLTKNAGEETVKDVSWF